MEVSELDKAVAYTKQFIDAVTPIAKQAYEIGLVTIRIDAAGSIVMCAVALLLALFAARWVRADYGRAKALADIPENKNGIWTRDPSDHMIGGGVLHVFMSIFSFFSAAISIVCLADIWLWVKIFSPQLWLAHRAVVAVLK